jgi:S-formylglutathione hydrolase FrmB
VTAPPRGRRRRRAGRVLAAVLGASLAAGCGHDGAGAQGGTDRGASAPRPDDATATADARPAAPAGIALLGERRLDARLREWTLRTTALDRPTRVRVLLPAGYHRHPRRRYPVLYLLHGCCSDFRSWTAFGRAEAITARYPLIVVMPDAGRQGWYTDWYRGAAPVRPRWETYHVGQLVPFVDARLRTIAARRGRAIAGLSMGGYGALSYAARHPGLFVAAASFSGALEIGSEAAWGSRAEQPARWRAHLPISLAARLRSRAVVELRTGDGAPGPLDHAHTSPGCGACRIERFLHPMNVHLHERLRRLGIRHVWDDYGPGTHAWPYWRRDLRETLPDLMAVLG